MTSSLHRFVVRGCLTPTTMGMSAHQTGTELEPLDLGAPAVTQQTHQIRLSLQFALLCFALLFASLRGQLCSLLASHSSYSDCHFWLCCLPGLFPLLWATWPTSAQAAHRQPGASQGGPRAAFLTEQSANSCWAQFTSERHTIRFESANDFVEAPRGGGGRRGRPSGAPMVASSRHVAYGNLLLIWPSDRREVAASMARMARILFCFHGAKSNCKARKAHRPLLLVLLLEFARIIIII